MRAPLCAMALLISSACFSGCPSRVSQPSLSVQVVDDVSGLPLAGMPVEYAIRYEVSRGKFLGVVPAPDPTLGYRLELLPGAVSNAAGIVEIGARQVTLRRGETISGETLLINARVDAVRPGVMRLKEILSSACRRTAGDCWWPPSDVGVAMWAAPYESERRELLAPANPGYSGAVVFVHASPAEPEPAAGCPPPIVALDHVSTRVGPEKIVVRLRRQPEPMK